MLEREQKYEEGSYSSFDGVKNELGCFKNPEENLDDCVRGMIADKVTPEGIMPDEVYEMAIEARNVMTSMGYQAGLANDRDEYLRIKGSEWLVANALVKMVPLHPAFIRNPDLAAKAIEAGVAILGAYTVDPPDDIFYGSALDERCDEKTLINDLSRLISHDELWRPKVTEEEIRARGDSLVAIAGTLQALANTTSLNSFNIRMDMLARVLYSRDLGEDANGRCYDEQIASILACSFSNKWRLRQAVMMEKDYGKKLLAQRMFYGGRVQCRLLRGVRASLEQEEEKTWPELLGLDS